MKTGPFDLKKMENKVLGANLSRRTTVGGESPLLTHAAFDAFRPICV
jgi:hypothetical protein